MIQFTTNIKKFDSKGEKTGWRYIEIPPEICEILKSGNKKSFRVKGKLDNFSFEGISLLPMGGGEFIMAINEKLRKGIHKSTGSKVVVFLELDETERQLSVDFLFCLDDDPNALTFFNTLPKSHQHYFSNWIESAKTETTKSKRITLAVQALGMNLRFNEMMQLKKRNNNSH